MEGRIKPSPVLSALPATESAPFCTSATLLPLRPCRRNIFQKGSVSAALSRPYPLAPSDRLTAGIDLALGLIERDLGQRAAQRTARVLVVHHRRAGGQPY